MSKLNLGRYFDMYFASSFSYGIVRKTLQVHNATVECYDNDAKKKKRVPMLISDKIGLICWGGMSATTIWPIYLFKDMRQLELNYRAQVEPSWYNISEKTSVHDYIFS